MCNQHTTYWYCRVCNRLLAHKARQFEICDEAMDRGAPGRCKSRITDTNARYYHPQTCIFVVAKMCRGEKDYEEPEPEDKDEDTEKEKDRDKDKGKGKERERKRLKKKRKDDKGESSQSWGQAVV
jgi:hypothetical protein